MRGLFLLMVTLLVSCNSAQDAEKQVKLKEAVSYGRTNEAAKLLEHGTTPDLELLGTPLIIIAAADGNIAMVGLLISYDVDVNATDPNGQTALERLVYSETLDEQTKVGIAERLIDSGASVDEELAIEADRQGMSDLAALLREKSDTRLFGSVG